MSCVSWCDTADDGVLTQMREIEKYLKELHDDIKEVEEAPSATSMSRHLL